MQHFLNLDRCSCGAYRYMAVREHKRSYQVYLIHHMHFPNGRDERKYSKLASIPKYKIDIHSERVNEFREGKLIRATFEEIIALRSILRQIDSAPEKTEDPDSSLERSAKEELQIPSEELA